MMKNVQQNNAGSPEFGFYVFLFCAKIKAESLLFIPPLGCVQERRTYERHRKRLHKQQPQRNDLVKWMRFFNGKSRREFREKAIRDHNSQIGSALRRGFKQGVQRGIEQGIQQGLTEERASLIRNMLKNGVSPESISKMTDISLEEIEAIKEQKTAE